MKKNDEIKELTPEQMRLVENLCKKIGLDDLTSNEKIAFAHAFDKNFDKFAGSDLVKNYPYIYLGGGSAGRDIQDMHSLLLILILKKDLEISAKQSTLINQSQQVIEQNNKIIELLTKISEK